MLSPICGVFYPKTLVYEAPNTRSSLEKILLSSLLQYGTAIRYESLKPIRSLIAQLELYLLSKM